MFFSGRVAPGATTASHGAGLWQNAWRPLVLAGIALVALLGYNAFALLAPLDGSRPKVYPVVRLMLLLLVPYGGASALLLLTPGPQAALWRRMEGAILAGGAVLFRIPLPFQIPQLSPDVYRYAWDARLTAHGLSPYLHGPSWPGYTSLRDAVLYPHVPWRHVPSIYPPGAQFFYWLVGLVAPGSIYGLKVEMAVFDLLAGGVLALLLARRGHDYRRAALYLWAPVPIVEFALNGHEDAIAIAFILLALLLDTYAFRGARVLVGVTLGIATLVKLYPLLLVVALVRRRERAMPLALVFTVLLGYAPYAGEGPQALGFLYTYLTQVQVSYGGVLLLIRTLGFALGATASDVRAIGAALAGCCVLAIGWLRLRPTLPWPWRTVPAPLKRLGNRLTTLPRLDVVTTACSVIILWFVFEPHVFPWYTAVLLPFVALLLPSAPALAAGALLFASFIPLAYTAYQAPPLYWLYPALYLAACALIVIVAAARWRASASPRVERSVP